MEGSTYKRCPCPVRRDAKDRRLACRKAHGSWYYTVDLPPAPGKTRRQKVKGGFPTEEAAQMALAEVIVAANRGEHDTHGEPERRTVGEFLHAWLATHRLSLKPTAASNYETLLRLYVHPRIGTTPLRKLTGDDLSALYATLLVEGGRKRVKDETGKTVQAADGTPLFEPAPLSNTTVRTVHRILHKALASAVTRRRLPWNPASQATIPRHVRPDTPVWTAETTATFLDVATDDRLYAAWLLALTCGLRRGELAGLRWCDVDLKAGTVTIALQRTADAQGNVVEGEPKGTSRRTVDVGGKGVTALVAHRARQEAERAAWGDGWSDSGKVFAQEDGRAYHPARLTELFQALAARIGVQVIRLHDGRHTCATLALDAGVHPKVVQELLGHSTFAITMDLYSHRVKRLQRDATSRIEDAIFSDKAG